jgi:hypothetical protein
MKEGEMADGERAKKIHAIPPLAYTVKLSIEMSMAELIAKVSRSSNKPAALLQPHCRITMAGKELKSVDSLACPSIKVKQKCAEAQRRLERVFLPLRRRQKPKPYSVQRRRGDGEPEARSADPG